MTALRLFTAMNEFAYFPIHRKLDFYELFLIIQTAKLYLAILHNPQ